MFDRLGEALTLLRLLRRLSQTELAERAGIQSNQVSRYEKGTVQSKPPQLQRLLDALGIGLQEFVYVLSAVERIQTMVVTAAGRNPVEVVAASGATAYWLEVADRHVRLASEVTEFVQSRMGTGCG